MPAVCPDAAQTRDFTSIRPPRRHRATLFYLPIVSHREVQQPGLCRIATLSAANRYGIETDQKVEK